jgi:hypothetical protein
MVFYHVLNLCSSCWSNEIAIAITTSKQVGIVKMLSVKYRVIAMKQCLSKTVVEPNVVAFCPALLSIPALHHIRWFMHPTVNSGE